VAILVVVFGAGAILGVALAPDSLVAPVESVTTPSPDTTDQGRRSGRDRPTPMYMQVPDLSEEQEARIDSIVRGGWNSRRELDAKYRPRFEALNEDYGSQRDDITGLIRAGIRSVMTPAQLEVYDALLADYDGRRAEDAARRQGDRRRDGDSTGSRRN
jgi:hypothetical protein